MSCVMLTVVLLSVEIHFENQVRDDIAESHGSTSGRRLVEQQNLRTQ